MKVSRVNGSARRRTAADGRWEIQDSRFKKKIAQERDRGQGRFRRAEIIRPDASARCPGEQVQAKFKPSPNRGQTAKTKPCEAMGINHFIVNGIHLDRQRRSHGSHRPWLQSLTAIPTPFSRKLLPMARVSILPIRPFRACWDGGETKPISTGRPSAVGSRKPHDRAGSWTADRLLLSDFEGTEATDLLKTKDRSRERTQYEPISEKAFCGNRERV